MYTHTHIHIPTYIYIYIYIYIPRGASTPSFTVSCRARLRARPQDGL